MATKMRQTEEECKAMEAKMSDHIKELEAKMKQMKTTQTPLVRNFVKSNIFETKTTFSCWCHVENILFLI